MPSTNSILISDRSKLFMSTAITDFSLANIKGIAGDDDANEIKNVTSIDMPLGWEKEKIELSIFGNQYKTFIFGQNNLMEFTFSFYLNFNDAKHKDIMDSETTGTDSNAEAWAGTQRGFMARYTDGTNMNYTYFTGYLNSVKLMTDFGDANKVEATVAIDGQMYTIAES